MSISSTKFLSGSYESTVNQSLKSSKTPATHKLAQLDLETPYKDSGKHDLESAVSAYLSKDKISCIRKQVNLDHDTHLTPKEYQSYLQIFSWAVIEHLETSSSLPKDQLTEQKISPLVEAIFKPTCKINSDISSDITPPLLRSLVIWYTTPSIG